MRSRLLPVAVGACLYVCGCAGVGEETGERVYHSSCLACHTTGAAGAPRLGDKHSWRQRADQGLAVLVNNAIHGKRGMPAKGGNLALTDDEIRQTVVYMLGQTGMSAN